MVSQAKMLVKGKNWVHGAKDQDDQVGQIKCPFLTWSLTKYLLLSVLGEHEPYQGRASWRSGGLTGPTVRGSSSVPLLDLVTDQVFIPDCSRLQ